MKYVRYPQRWGIRDEASNVHRTSEICLGEIARCAAAAAAAGPTALFFLLMLGDRVRAAGGACGHCNAM